MRGVIQPGMRLPQSNFAYLVDGELRIRTTEQIFSGVRAAVVGIPGAFTPVCTRFNIPRYVELAPKILASGLELIVCITPNDPWTLAAWSKQVDPEEWLLYLSDGNLEFGRACGLNGKHTSLFLGERLQRFSMIVNNGIVEKMSIENSILDVSCSAAEAIHLVPMAS